MKRKLSLLLVLALIISLVPMSAFAATDNSVDKVPKVADDAKFTKVSDAPKLRIEEKNKDEFGSANTDKQTFRLKLENAEWLDGGDVTGFAKFTDAMVSCTLPSGGQMFVSRQTDTTVEVTVYSDGVSGSAEMAYYIPMLMEVQGKGDVKVTVDPRDSVVSGGTYTIAVGAGGDTVTTVDDIKTFSDVTKLADLEIDETNVGAIGKAKDSKIKLKLPSDFEWKTTPVASDVEFTGGLKGSKVAKTTGDAIVKDDRTLEIYIDTTAQVEGTRGTILIKNLEITAKKDAKYGDVELSVSGDDISSEDIKVAKYVDYDVTIKADGDAKELIAGEFEGEGDDAHKLQTLLIKEEVKNAWLTDRKTRVEFPSWVKILKVDVTSDTENVNTSDLKAQLDIAKTDRDENYVEFTVKKDDDTDKTKKKAKVYLKFFVSVEANAKGDITAKVNGRSLGKDAEVVLGKAISPLTIEAKAENVRTGIKNQTIGDITIKEGKKEGIEKGELKFELDKDVEWSEVPTIKVTDGNVDLDAESAKINSKERNILTVKVKSDSSKPATIVLSNVKLDLNRSVPEGSISIKVGGDAIVRNYNKDNSDLLKEGYFKEEYVAEAVVANVITPADANTKAGQEVKFVIGNAEYQVGDEVKKADVAPYVKDGRTMLAVRYVAEAMGVAPESIVWEPVTRTVTIFKGDRIAQLTIGSKQMLVNGTPVMMDTAAEIKDGRTCLPISFVAKALGAEVAWDAATKTVTLK